MIWDEFLRHFRFCDEEDSGLSDEEQERKGPKNRPKHTRKRHEKGYIKPRKTFWRNSKQLLTRLTYHGVKVAQRKSFESTENLICFKVEDLEDFLPLVVSADR
ncbi:hypothetical protein [Bacteroides sp. An279]|uniref:hypothetical protein n=1 Tax=Bacteroides sp. An279 TaxID=1965620 RepID=UPI0013A6791E|nr:hypothetical protein [Bacteroides sp. An279]